MEPVIEVEERAEGRETGGREEEEEAEYVVSAVAARCNVCCDDDVCSLFCVVSSEFAVLMTAADRERVRARQNSRGRTNRTREASHTQSNEG